jgi:outer membrane murein-binding lipoprotein Lpp
LSRRLAAALLAVTLATGCHTGHRTPRTTVETRFLDQLAAAISGLNAARQRVADDAAALGNAAAALDDVDGVAVTGDRAAVRRARAAGAPAIGKGLAAARRMPADVTAYAAAVAALAAAPTDGLTAEQAAALQDVVTAVRAEATGLHAYGTVVATVWPRYAALDGNQTLWLARASNGWYRTQQEAAGNYLVLGDRDALDAGRRSFATADAQRLGAARRAATAIDAARAALASLLR